jgi:hypothetical protein
MPGVLATPQIQRIRKYQIVTDNTPAAWTLQ